MIVSIVSRAWRSTEFRFDGFDVRRQGDRVRVGPDQGGRLSRPGADRGRVGGDFKEKEIEVRTRHRIPGTVPIMFVQAELADPSDFHHRPLLRIARENGRVVIHVTRCCPRSRTPWPRWRWRSHPKAAVPELHFGWSVENPVTANLHFVLFGHGQRAVDGPHAHPPGRCSSRPQTAHHRGVRGSELASRERFLLHDRRKLFG